MEVSATELRHIQACVIMDIQAYRGRVRTRHGRRTLLRQAQLPKLRGRRVWKGVGSGKRGRSLDLIKRFKQSFVME